MTIKKIIAKKTNNGVNAQTEAEIKLKIKTEAETKAKIEREIARLKAETQARAEAEIKAKLEAEAKVERETARLKAEAQAKAEAEIKAKLEAELASPDIDSELRALAEAIKNGEEIEPFPSLQTYWNTKSVNYLKYRHQFAQIFGSDESDRYQAVRKVFVNQVYKQLPLHNKLEWLSQSEVEKRRQASFLDETDKSNCRIFGSGYYYHSTHLDALENILKSGRLEVRQGGGFKGAFVSSSPFVFGKPYVLVFRRVIEHLSTILSGFYSGLDYWAGFSADIPINQTTLAYILKKDNEKSNAEIGELCEKWMGRKIKIINEKEYLAKWKDKINALGMGIPSHWQDHTHNDSKPNIKFERVALNFAEIENEETNISSLNLQMSNSDTS